MLGPPLRPLTLVGGEPEGLDELIEGWWTVTTSGEGTVTPDGAVDLVLISGHAPVVAGPDICPRPVDLPAGLTIVALRLRPGVAGQLLGDRVDRAVGQQVPIDRVLDRSEADRLDDDLGPTVSAGPGPGRGRDPEAEEVARTLARGVRRAIPPAWSPDPVVVDAVAALDRGDRPDPGALSPRQFRRRFSAAMGYGPAVYHRIARLDRFTDLLPTAPDRTLADLAARTGYYDQAHLTRDCRDLLGVTPGELRPNR